MRESLATSICSYIVIGHKHISNENQTNERENSIYS